MQFSEDSRANTFSIDLFPRKENVSHIYNLCSLFSSSLDQAFVTLATNDSYARGAMVLGKSLRNHNTSKKLVALIGPQVSEPSK